MRTKYPRTLHLPWSPGATGDDLRQVDASCFEGREVVVTEKMDGENTTLYRDGLHARSIDGRHHPSRDWVKGLHGRICWQIPEGWRVCGENLFARHSIGYAALPSYFMAFSVWNDAGAALSWDDTVSFCASLGVDTVPVLWRGVWEERAVRALDLDVERQEGYVVRVAEAFEFDAFSTSLAKWVRRDHVTSDQHWMHAAIVPNGLAGDADE